LQSCPPRIAPRMRVQGVPGLAKARAFEVQDRRRTARFGRRLVPKHVGSERSRRPQEVLRVPTRVKDKPASGEGDVQRVLVRPHELSGARGRHTEHGRECALTAESLQIKKEDTAVEVVPVVADTELAYPSAIGGG